VTLPGQLENYGEASVLSALVCFEGTGTMEFAGRDADLAEELLRCALVRATVSARFLMTDGELRLRVLSQGLTVAGAWMKRVLEASPRAKL
jgi:hypothetical protein